MTCSDADHRAAGCDGKHPFTDRGLASRIAKQQNRRKDAARVEAYRCPHCRNWHVGRPGMAKRKQRRDKQQAGKRQSGRP